MRKGIVVFIALLGIVLYAQLSPTSQSVVKSASVNAVTPTPCNIAVSQVTINAVRFCFMIQDDVQYIEYYKIRGARRYFIFRDDPPFIPNIVIPYDMHAPPYDISEAHLTGDHYDWVYGLPNGVTVTHINYPIPTITPGIPTATPRQVYLPVIVKDANP